MRHTAELHRQSPLELPGLTHIRWLVVVLALVAPAAASGQTAGSVPPDVGDIHEVSPASPLGGRKSTPRQVIALARTVPKIAAELRRHPGAEPRVYAGGTDEWRVVFNDGDREIAQVTLADAGPRVTEAWTGIQVSWRMARGYEGAFGRRAASLPVWLALLLAFVLPFLRPPWRWLHVDLAVLASFSISLAFFSHAMVHASIPLAYPPLAYLLVRLLVIARKPDPPPPVRLLLSPDALLIGIVFLIGLRVGLQITSSNVIDVGYAGVIGADHITHGHAIYGAFPADNSRGDTYGPFNYLAYVPFELIWPWHGVWDDLPAGHAAAATFDLLCAGGLFLVGRRLRGQDFGFLLTYLWLACPFTLFVANSGANDALVGLLVLGALALGPAARGASLAAAVLTKFAPLGLLPLLVRSRRSALAGLAVVAALLAFVAVLDGGLGEFFDRTLGFQLDRKSPFSLWGLYHLPLLQHVVQAAGGVLILALALRRDRTPVSVAAATAASLVAIQLGMSHWFYLYLGWVLPVALIALVAPYVAVRSSGSIELARPPSPQRITTPMSHGSSSAAS
ncbi:MAG: hypothetical protein QOF76_2781 [Solirubrobacteraceae bacterium]|nr:hypothetical protein [Solirubrobacteraceae bacterium]